MRPYIFTVTLANGKKIVISDYFVETISDAARRVQSKFKFKPTIISIERR